MEKENFGSLDYVVFVVALLRVQLEIGSPPLPSLFPPFSLGEERGELQKQF